MSQCVELLKKIMIIYPFLILPEQENLPLTIIKQHFDGFNVVMAAGRGGQEGSIDPPWNSKNSLKSMFIFFKFSMWSPRNLKPK